MYKEECNCTACQLETKINDVIDTTVRATLQGQREGAASYELLKDIDRQKKLDAAALIALARCAGAIIGRYEEAQQKSVGAEFVDLMNREVAKVKRDALKREGNVIKLKVKQKEQPPVQEVPQVVKNIIEHPRRMGIDTNAIYVGKIEG